MTPELKYCTEMCLDTLRKTLIKSQVNSELRFEPRTSETRNCNDVHVTANFGDFIIE
jgi:hypothetical protein